MAGLGRIGKNLLLANAEYGNMIRLGAILADIVLEPDPLIEEDYCSNGCEICIDSCPQKALSEQLINQKLCRQLSNIKNESGDTLKNCFVCRKQGPNVFGV